MLLQVFGGTVIVDGKVEVGSRLNLFLIFVLINDLGSVRLHGHFVKSIHGILILIAVHFFQSRGVLFEQVFEVDRVVDQGPLAQ